MNGFIRKTVAGLCLGAGFTTLSGCWCYRQIVDPCYPERYNYQARQPVREAFFAQASNGHVLDQTVWNHFFEPPVMNDKTKQFEGYDRLNPAGIEHLKYLVRRRPAPDGKIYLQTANDLQGNLPPEKVAQIRSDVDAKRITAVRNHLTALMASREQQVAFDVMVHDIATPHQMSLPIAGAQQIRPTGVLSDYYGQFKGSMGGAAGGTSSGGGGSSSGGGR